MLKELQGGEGTLQGSEQQEMGWEEAGARFHGAL